MKEFRNLNKKNEYVAITDLKKFVSSVLRDIDIIWNEPCYKTTKVDYNKLWNYNVEYFQKRRQKIPLCFYHYILKQAISVSVH